MNNKKYYKIIASIDELKSMGFCGNLKGKEGYAVGHTSDGIISVEIDHTNEWENKHSVYDFHYKYLERIDLDKRYTEKVRELAKDLGESEEFIKKII